MRAKGTVSVTMVSLSVAASCGWGAGGRTPGDPSEALWNRTFRSISVTESGDPRELLPDTRVVVSLTANPEADPPRWAGWEAGCNQISVPVEVTPELIRAQRRQVHSTAMQCESERQAQDDWLSDFMLSSPRWQLDGARLTLTSDETAIWLDEESLGLTVPEFEDRWNTNVREHGSAELLDGALSTGMGAGKGHSGFPIRAEEWVTDDLGGSVSTNADGSLYQVSVGSATFAPRSYRDLIDEATLAACAVLIKTISPQLDWDQGVADALDEIGIVPTGEPVEARTRDLVVGDVRYRFEIQGHGDDHVSVGLSAGPVVAAPD